MNTTLKLFFNYYKEPKKNSFIFIFFSICTSLLEVSTIFLFYIYIKYLSENSINSYLDSIFRFFYKDVELNYFIFLSGLLLVFYLVKLVINFSFSYWKNSFIQKIYNYYSTTLFKHYLSKNYNFFLSKDSSIIINNIFSETKNYSSCINFVLIFFSELIIFFSIILFLLNKEFYITMYILFFILLFSIFYRILLKKIIFDLGKKRLNTSGVFLKFIRETLDGIKSIKIYNKEDFFYSRAKKEADSYSKNATIQGFFFDLPRLLVDFILFIFILILVFFNNHYKNFIQDNSAIFALFIISLYRILPSINRIATSYQNLIFFSPVSKVLENEFLSSKYKKKELIDSQEINLVFKKNIKIDNLFFRHNNQEINFFNNLSLTIKKNDCVGIFGASGSGKSTLVDLIACILNGENSYLTIDDYHIKSSADSSIWKNKIGYVAQSTFILNDTLRNNIAFGLDKEKINDDKVLSVLKSVQLNNLLLRFDHNLNYLLSENGSNLSIGEKQRIGIARALYRESEVYIFDEPTSSLDPDNEKIFINFLEEFKKNKTVIMISHKKSNLRICNIIFEVIVYKNLNNIISRKILVSS